MVSHASFLRINTLIFAIFAMVIAKVILTIVGNPSGTAATINPTQTINAVLTLGKTRWTSFKESTNAVKLENDN